MAQGTNICQWVLLSVVLTVLVVAVSDSKAFVGLVGISRSSLFSPSNPNLSPWRPGQ